MSKESPEFFFSYARRDSEFVLNLATQLRAAGAHVWLDQLDILGGQRWDEAIENALRRCDGVLTVLSPDSVGSQNFMDEVSYALEEGKQVVPILYRECAIPFRLRRLHYVDFTVAFDRAFEHLLRALGLEGDEAVPGPVRREVQRPTEAEAQGAEERPGFGAGVPGSGESRGRGRPAEAAGDATWPAGIIGPAGLAVMGAVAGAIGGAAEKAMTDPWVLSLGILAGLIILSVARLVHHLRRNSRGRAWRFQVEALVLWAAYTISWSTVNRWWSDFYVLAIFIWLIIALVGGVALLVRPARSTGSVE